MRAFPPFRISLHPFAHAFFLFFVDRPDEFLYCFLNRIGDWSFFKRSSGERPAGMLRGNERSSSLSGLARKGVSDASMPATKMGGISGTPLEKPPHLVAHDNKRTREEL